jgi:SAM-dependent methyltransferase
MEHESMVYALDEIRRTLKPNGILIDLRPVESNWSVEVASAAGCQLSGRLNDTPIGLADDEAAFKTMREVESRRWYIKEKEEEFAFFYYWDAPSEMKEFVEVEWEDFKKMDDAVFQKINSLWVLANADARVRVRVKMLIVKWKRA